ncbi:hypothetical protein C8R44DRAFT_865665 [Mycena epipterygia]|nr:hypothetical protein C8R44DRAFT_865665 [Mycena epipterygia]
MSLPTFSSSTTADEVATTFAAEIRGKNGTSLNGIGFEVARVISKLKLSEDAIKKEVPSTNIRRLVLDLSSLAAVRKAAAEANAYPELIRVLIHNAAAGIGAFKLTADQLESQIATDHIGPFPLTKLLAPKILAAGTASYVPRLVFVASVGHSFGTGVDFDTLAHPDADKYKDTDAYNQAKSANVLTAIELSKRYKGRINAYGLHPGVIYTNMPQKEESLTAMQAYDKPGAYLSDCNEANKDVAAHSSDPVNAAKLWTVTEEIIGEKFAF